MSKALIYLFAIFALWLYFKYGNFATNKTDLKKYADDGVRRA